MSAENAVKKGLIKVGDTVLVEMEVYIMRDSYFFDKYDRLYENEKIRIPIQEPKPIDFGVAGRVLKYIYQGEDFLIVQTTGYISGKTFAAFVIDPLKTSWKKGEVNMFACALPDAWQDITDTYKP
jgi:hypothetical protein